MQNENQNLEKSTDREVLITRVIKAPRELVFKAWTTPEIMVNWYAPNGCTILISKYDVRKGGTILTCIKVPQYKDCWCTGEFIEVIAPERLVYTMAIADETGKLLTANEAGMDPDWPEQTTVTLTFEEEGNTTKITLHQTVSESLAKRTGAYPSWLQMLDNLERELVSRH